MQVESGRLRVVGSPEPREEPANQADSEVSEAPSPGRYIREQRQRRGMSVEQLAAATKIPRSSIVLLEDDRHQDLPGLVFAKGFLRCCARALEVDGDAVMELLYERERIALGVRRRDKGSVPTPEPAATAPYDAAARCAPPRIRRSTPPVESPLARVVATLPTPTTLLWVVVAALVAMVLMAAFNLMGTGGPGAAT